MRLRCEMLFLVAVVSSVQISAQGIKELQLGLGQGVGIMSVTLMSGEKLTLPRILPLFTIDCNDSIALSSLDGEPFSDGDSISFSLTHNIRGSARSGRGFGGVAKMRISLTNSGLDTVQLANFVPFGKHPDQTYIAAIGPHRGLNYLSRSVLFRPGHGPIGVVLPDNAWELGFGDVAIGSDRSLVGLARRRGAPGSEARRFRTFLPPGGRVEYDLYIDSHGGGWREGLALVFRERWIYDLEKFDNTLFERRDLEWIRHSYLLTIQFAWDHEYFDAVRQVSTYRNFLRDKMHLLGKFDAFVLWPTWPRLGLDRRNQWDMYRDLPGGLSELRRQSDFANSLGTKYFISYNPWDESTRKEDHLQAMKDLLRATNADGVVLDTWGASSKEFQGAADSVKPGIILYSEGMAVPVDMPGIVAGRVHDALFMPPPLNLNKLIKPDFAIFRVLQVKDGMLHREVAVSLFNGYGNEVNTMFPGRPAWIEEEFRYLGRATRILRENSSAFLSQDWAPLVDSDVDSIWVNRWPGGRKTIFTVLSMRPEGHSGPLFEEDVTAQTHWVSLWRHEELKPPEAEGKSHVPVQVQAFDRNWLGTRQEGNVDVVAELPSLLTVKLEGELLHVSATAGEEILMWAGDPSYERTPKRFGASTSTITLHEHFGAYEGKIVVQLMEKGELLDERIVTIPFASPRLISTVERTAPSATAPTGMVEIPAGSFTFKTARSFLSPNEVIPYPDYSAGRSENVRRIFMDRTPVTNVEFQKFLRSTGYRPKDPANFLKHWTAGRPPAGKEKHPVVYVSLEDARAYARWAGKRLATENEWQYAAQGTDGRKFPWGNSFDSTLCNNGSGETTPVDAYPEGKSPFGVLDCVGNVWQLTNDVYDNGTNYFVIIRGGSHYRPQGSVWYVQGGPQPVDNPQILLMVSPGFDRAATVGFRCVKDAR